MGDLVLSPQSPIFLSRSPCPSPFTPATQAIKWGFPVEMTCYYFVKRAVIVHFKIIHIEYIEWILTVILLVLQETFRPFSS